MKNSEKQKSTFSSVIVAQQPILDRDEKVWGYEILFRSPSEGSLEGAGFLRDDAAATRSVLADGLELISSSIGTEKMLINFPGSMLKDGTARFLPVQNTVIEILENTVPEPEILKSIEELHQLGYTIALDDYIGQDELQPFLRYVDLVKVDVLGQKSELLEELVKRIRLANPRKEMKILAEKIENKQIYQYCRELGFDYFQGYYFAKPEIKKGKKMLSSETIKLKLLALLNDPDFDIDEITKIIQSDTALSVKLLRYLNSAAVGLQHPIVSVKHSLSILGSLRLKQWLTVIALNELGSDNMSSQLALNAAINGFFLYDLVRKSAMKASFVPENVCLLGLLHSVKPILGEEYESFIQSMLHQDLVDPLIYGKGPYSIWVKFLEEYQSGDMAAIESFCETYSLSKQLLNQSYFENSANLKAFFVYSSA